MHHRPLYTRPTNTPLRFQVLEFVCEDTTISCFGRHGKRNAIIYAFGVTEEGYSVCAAVTGFLPFFFIELAPTAIYRDFVKIIKAIGNQLSKEDMVNIAVDECEIVSRTSFYGFQNSKKRNFGCIRFKTFATCKNVYSNLTREGKYSTFEGKLDQLFKFLHSRKFESWVEIPANAYVSAPGYAKTQICVEVDWMQFNAVDETKIAPLWQCTVDIETGSTDENLGTCFIITTAFKTFGSTPGKFDLKHTIIVGDESAEEPTKDDQVVVVKRCVTEVEALLEWANLIEGADPDVIYTWNGDYFDFHYMVERAKYLKIDVSFLSRVSRIHHKPAEMEEVKFESKAYGLSEFRRLQMYGRINADLLPYFRKETKHRLYELGYIADQYDVDGGQIIFDSHRDAEVARRCMCRTLLPQLLADKLKIVPNLVELSRVTHVPIRYLLHRGQQIRTMSLLSRYTYEAQMLIPDINEVGESDDVAMDPQSDIPEVNLGGDMDTLERFIHDKKRNRPISPVAEGGKRLKMGGQFEGSTVMEPVVGAYHRPIAVLDFASLYPNIIRTDNLCYSTFVVDVTTIEHLPEYLISTVNDENDTFLHKFVKKGVHEGILPRMLADLAQLRKNAKKDLFIEQSKAYPDEFVCSILDARQLSLKLTMNSCYGFLGAQMLPCRQIGETVTSRGRGMLRRTKTHIETKWGGDPWNVDPTKRGARVIYGDTDSVFVDLNRNPRIFPTMEHLIAFAENMAADVTSTCFRSPHKLEFEKIYQPFFMLSKKRYFGLKFDTSKKTPVLENRGTVLQQRDVCPFVQETYAKCQECVLGAKEGGNRALLLLSKTLDDLIDGRVDIEKFVITKTYAREYSNTVGIPHAAVVEKMRSRGVDIQIGDAVEFVYTRYAHRRASGPSKKLTKSDRAQDLEFFRSSGGRYEIDADIYIDFLEKPLTQLLNTALGENVSVALFREKRLRLH